MSSIDKIEELDKKFKPTTVDVSEDTVKEIVRMLIFAGSANIEEKDLLYEIIKHMKCDIKTAQGVFDKMKELGLQVCYYWQNGYSIRRFADMRHYVTEEEFKKLDKEELEKLKKENEREAKFIEKYGADKSKWSDDVWDEYEYGDDEEDDD